MTTAHRPTYNPARGSSYQGGNKLYMPSLQYSSKDLPGNLTLKQRKLGQGHQKDVNKIDFKKNLLERENRAKSGKTNVGLVSSIYGDSEDFNETNLLGQSRNQDITSDLLALEEPQKKRRLDNEVETSEIRSNTVNNNNNSHVFVQDIDDEFEEDLSSIDAEEDEEEDDEEELMKEYEKIKKIREEEKKQKERELTEKMKQQSQEQILLGNPLLNDSHNYSLKKKWFEDTVFKNQAKNEPKVKKRFINDTVRSDFHRKFIAKSVQ